MHVQSRVDQNPMPLFTFKILSDLLVTEVELRYDLTDTAGAQWFISP